MKKTLVLILTIWIAFGCKTENVEPGFVNIGQGFLPMQIGNYWVYDCIRIKHNFFPRVSDTTTFELKEIIADTFRSDDGIINYRLERYKRATDTTSWQIDSVWTAYQKQNLLIRVENNLAIAKHNLPAEEGKRWNGNLLNYKNTIPGSFNTFSYTNAGALWHYKQFSFNRTITVEQANDSNCINLTHLKNIYADEVGLLERVERRIKYKQDDDCSDAPELSDGDEYFEYLKEYGKEN